MGWIGVDLDGTLAEYHGFAVPEVIGKPIAPMVDRVKRWLSVGKEVRIVTARVCPNGEGDNPDPEPWKELEEVEGHIRRWCLEHIGEELEVTCQKDYMMEQLWDDRAIQVEFNMGRVLYGEAEDGRDISGQSDEPLEGIEGVGADKVVAQSEDTPETASLTSLRESIDRVLSVCGGKPDFLKVDAIIDLVRPIVDRNKWLEGVNEKAEASALEWRDRHIGGHEHYLNHLNDALQDGDV